MLTSTMLPWNPMLVALFSFRADFTAAIRSPRLVVMFLMMGVVMKKMICKILILSAESTKDMRSHHLLVNKRKHIATHDGDYEDHDVVDQ